MAESDQTASPKADSPKLYYIKDARAKSVSQPLTGSQDLITTFNLLPLYNQYVKQKGENNEDLPPLEQTYLPFISELPGKNVIRPGNHIRALLEAPEKTYGPIHPFSSSTMRDSFNLRPGPIPGFDASVLGTEEDSYRQSFRNTIASGGDSLKSAASSAMPGYADSASVSTNASPAQSSHSHHHHSHSHSHSHHGSKSSVSSPHVERAERGEGDGSREHKHKKKKKKRKHEHDHEHAHHDGEGDSEHRKKKKRKREREEHGEHGEKAAM